MRGIAAGLMTVGMGMVAAAGIGCKSVPPPTPLNELNAQQMRGHGVFEARCGQCHHDRESGPLHGPSLEGIFKKKYLPSGAPANDDRVETTVMYGHGIMPAVGNTMDAQDMADLMAYLHTL